MEFDDRLDESSERLRESKPYYRKREIRGAAEVELGVKWYPGSEPESLCSSFESFLEMSVTYAASLSARRRRAKKFRLRRAESRERHCNYCF